MTTNDALANIKQLINAAIKSGLFGDAESVIQVNEAYNTLVKELNKQPVIVNGIDKKELV